MKTYVLFIDNKSCWGCKTCEVACKQEHRAPDGVKYITVVEDGPKPVNEKIDFVFRVNVCLHCDAPPCAEACPIEAITKRDDGIVILDHETCTGCAACIDACPYQAIVFNEKTGKACKCNLCFHRVDRGLIPACADNVCQAHCIYFGRSDQVKQMITDKTLLKERLAADTERRKGGPWVRSIFI